MGQARADLHESTPSQERPDSTPGDTLPAHLGCTRLCAFLGALGLVLSLAGAAVTHQLLHEPLESVAASTSAQMAASACTASNLVLTRLLLLRTPPGGAARQQPGELPAGLLQNIWTRRINQADALRTRDLPAELQGLAPALRERLRGLPPAASPGTTPSPPAAGADSAADDRQPRRCPDIGLSDLQRQVSVLPLTGGSPPASAEPGWLAFVHRAPEQDSLVIAVTDFRRLIDRIGHAESHWRHRQTANIRLGLAVEASNDPAVPTRPLPIDDAVPHGDEDLRHARLIPYSNANLLVTAEANHRLIDRTSRRAAGLMLLIGLATTTAVVLISRNSQRRLMRLSEEFRRESRTDRLTQAANRRAWDEALAIAEECRQRHGQTYGLIVIDLNGFKQINDQQGHHCGDRVLRNTAVLLQRELRSADVLARLGGDEFAILLDRPKPYELRTLVQRLRNVLTAAGIEASFGAALSDRETTLEQSWTQADRQMYADKPLTDPSAC